MVDFEYECYQYCKLEDQNAEEDNPPIEQQEEEVTGIEAGDLCDIENEDPEDPLAEFPEGCDPTKENGEKQCPDDLSFTELPPLIPVGGCPEFNPDNDNDADNDGIPDEEDKDDNNDGIPDEEIPITPEPEDCDPDLDPDCPKPTQEDPKEDHPCDVIIEPDCIDPNDVPIINSEEPYDCECENPPDVGEVGYCPPEIWTKQCGDGSDGPVPGTILSGGEDFCDCDNPNIGPGDIGYCPPEKCQKINPPEVVVVVPEVPTKPPVKPNPFLNQTRGCKEPDADNYDETATVNDPSLCVYPVDVDKEPTPVFGCMDDKADNYNPDATTPDGSCTYTIPGCMDRKATNFDPEANKDDGTCKYPVEGCTDERATNYDPAATKDNGTCELPVPGCIDRTALNYNEHATEPDGSCIYPVEGCTDDKAENFNVSANVDDGSCTYVIEGCMDDKAPNFNPEATVHDFSCEPYDVYGCMNPEAANYMEGATKDDGSCFRPGCNDSDATNFDPKATENDGSCKYPEGETPGCMDNRATNYNPNATVDDGTCDIPKILGCTDPSAANYNPLATEPDGSCYDKITITPIIPPVTEPVPPTPVTEPVPVPPHLQGVLAFMPTSAGIPCWDDDGNEVACPDDDPDHFKDPDGDWDDDGIPDVDDPDVDNDGVPNAKDVDPLYPNIPGVLPVDPEPQHQPSEPVADFLGTKTLGKNFAFILDRSGSMNWGLVDNVNVVGANRWNLLKAQVIRCLNKLPDDAKVRLTVFSGPVDDPTYHSWIPDEDYGWHTLGDTTAGWGREALIDTINRVQVGGSTEPNKMISKVFNLGQTVNPDVVYCLSDGGFTYGIPFVVQKHFIRKAKKYIDTRAGVVPPLVVHTFTIVDPGGRLELQQIVGHLNTYMGYGRWAGPCTYRHLTFADMQGLPTS